MKLTPGQGLSGQAQRHAAPRQAGQVRVVAARHRARVRLLGLSGVVRGSALNHPELTPEAEGTDDKHSTWQRLTLLSRQMDVAVAEEDYRLASKLRDERQALLQTLPIAQQYVQRHTQLLRTGTLLEKMQAIKAMVDTGDPVAIPEVAACLRDPELQDLAHEACWALFMRHKDADVMEMMAEGVSYMTSPATHDKALAVFSQMIKRAPDFPEAYNKRATMLYILKRFEEGIEDCKQVLRMQPYHFGAASGMGLCYLMLSRENEAVAAFEQTLSIHPGMHDIQRVLAQLKRRMAQQQLQQEAAVAAGEATDAGGAAAGGANNPSSGNDGSSQ